jgi:hypothetical protein
MCVCCECGVMSGRGLCDGLLTHPVESYRVWCVLRVCFGNLVNEEAKAQWGLSRQKERKENIVILVVNLIIRVELLLNSLTQSCTHRETLSCLKMAKK